MELKKLAEPRALGTSVLGLCVLALASSGCGDDSSGDGTVTTNPTTDNTTQTGSATMTDTGMDTTADTSGGPGTDDGTGSADTGPPPDGLGCMPAPSCDKGAYDGNLYVTDQASMEEIQGHTSITGFLAVEASDMECLSFLSCLETANGVFIQDNEYLESFGALEALQSSTFGFVVDGNPALTDVSGATVLSTVTGGNLTFFDNNALTTLSGFEALTEVSGDLIISDNDALVDISGFNALVQVTTFDNPDPDPGEPPTYGGSLNITQHAALESVTGFTSLVAIHKNLTISFNEVLNDLSGMHDLKAVGEKLTITNNPNLCITEAAAVGNDLEQGPGPGSSSANNDDSC